MQNEIKAMFQSMFLVANTINAYWLTPTHTKNVFAGIHTSTESIGSMENQASAGTDEFDLWPRSWIKTICLGRHCWPWHHWTLATTLQDSIALGHSLLATDLSFPQQPLLKISNWTCAILSTCKDPASPSAGTICLTFGVHRHCLLPFWGQEWESV